MTSILWRCPPDTRPAQRFCDYGNIIPLFLKICNLSEFFDLRLARFLVYYVWNIKRPAMANSSGALTVGDTRAVAGLGIASAFRAPTRRRRWP